MRTVPSGPMSSMSSSDDVPDAAGLTRALDVLDELHRRLGDEGLRDVAELHRRRRVGALRVAVRACAAGHRARELDPAAATAEALADMRAGAARSPVLHTLARVLERERERDGPSVEEAARRLLGDVSADVLRELEAAVGRVRARERPADRGR